MYNPNEKRVPAGKSTGGQWTAGDAGSAIKKAASDKKINKLTIDSPLSVSEIDSVTGLREWDTAPTLKSLIASGWDFSISDLQKLENGETLKDVSPNGRRVINVKAKK